MKSNALILQKMKFWSQMKLYRALQYSIKSYVGREHQPIKKQEKDALYILLALAIKNMQPEYVLRMALGSLGVTTHIQTMQDVLKQMIRRSNC